MMLVSGMMMIDTNDNMGPAQVSSLEQELACSSGIMTAFDSVLQMLPDHRLSDLDRYAHKE